MSDAVLAPEFAAVLIFLTFSRISSLQSDICYSVADISSMLAASSSEAADTLETLWLDSSTPLVTLSEDSIIEPACVLILVM